MRSAFRFIDLFAGLGGFHSAAAALGGECVFASEIKGVLRDNYLSNFGIYPAGDITTVSVDDIPSHDLLCAGFPCQPFSKAGSQKGWKDATRGTLFFVIAQILEVKRPRFVVLENVANFIKHDGGNTYRQVITTLRQLGYDVSSAKLSPHRYGVPQHRERMYVVAALESLSGFEWPVPTDEETHISQVLDLESSAGKPLGRHVLECLEIWQEFLELIPSGVELPYYPIWSMEAGATYPLDKPISSCEAEELWSFKGSFGVSLSGLSMQDIKKRLPSHALRSVGFPAWKVSFIERNRRFFSDHSSELSGWLEKIQKCPSSFQKLEWNNKGGKRDIWSHLIQVRASGVRVKRASFAPALVSASDSQIPVVPWLKRYLSVRECARLQSMDDLLMPSYVYDAYEALGNAVNVKLVNLIINELMKCASDDVFFDVTKSSVEAVGA